MSVQELKYKHRDAIAVDGAGNLVTDSAGNLGNVIPPVIISPSASFIADEGIQDKSCWYGSIEYGGETYEWSGCSDNGESNPIRIETEGFLLRFVLRGADGFAAVTNLRNLAKVHDSLTIKVYAGNNFEPEIKKISETEEFITYSTEHDASRHGISVRWGEQSIWDSGYLCPGNDYYVGSVTINFSDLTVTLNTDGVKWKPATFKCGVIWDEPIDPDVTIIIVYAAHEWCSPESGVQAYTEVSQVVEGSRVWQKPNNRVIVTEGRDEELAKDEAAWTRVASFETRDYIVGEDGTVYWEDVEYEPETATEIRVEQLYDGITGEVLWTTGVSLTSISPSAYATGKVWEKASTEQLTTIAEQRNFPASGAEISDGVADVKFEGLYIRGGSEDFYSWGYLLNPSCSVESFTCGTEYKYFVLAGERNGVSITLQSDIYDALIMDDPEYIGGCDGLADFVQMEGVGWLNLYPQPAYECGVDDGGSPYPFFISSKHGDLGYKGGDSGWEVFSINGGIFTPKYPTTYGYVYEFVRRWVTSPCDAEEPMYVYTGSASGKYYASAEDAINDADGKAVTNRGNNVYSFVQTLDSTADHTFYRVGVPLPDTEEETTDEEFE